MAGQDRRERQAFWRSAIRRQEESGLPAARFCRREGLHPVTFYGWRRKLQQERVSPGVGAAAESKPAAATPSFIPVRLLEERESAAVEVVSPSGLVLRVSHDADTENVRRVLQLLQEIA